MRPRASRILVMSAVSAAVAVTACRDRSAETGVAAPKVEHVVRELERAVPDDALLLEEDQAAEQAAAEFEAQQVAETVARERDELRHILESELAWVDKRIADLRRGVITSRGEIRVEKMRDVAAARAFRARLERDQTILDRAPDDGSWDAVKDRIARDVDEDRPASIPRTYETSYDL